MLKELKITSSKKQEIINLTDKIKKIVEDSGIKSGICIIYLPHATAGILINENNDPYFCKDILNQLNKLFPEKAGYEHDKIDNNAHAHLKSSLIKTSETLIIENGKLILGTWQAISLAEFDGPKTRNVLVKLIKG